MGSKVVHRKFCSWPNFVAHIDKLSTEKRQKKEKKRKAHPAGPAKCRAPSWAAVRRAPAVGRLGLAASAGPHLGPRLGQEPVDASCIDCQEAIAPGADSPKSRR
jgi:hypothetical protein